MAENEHPRELLRKTDRPEERTFSHPLNERSEMRGVMLGDVTGLSRIGVHLIRVPPGRESCVLHTHNNEEEFLFILSGRGVAEIGEEIFEVGSGDFMGFPTPSVAHNLRNDGDEDLVYLVGGERKEVEVAEFPALGKTVFRVGREVRMVDTAEAELMWKQHE